MTDTRTREVEPLGWYLTRVVAWVVLWLGWVIIAAVALLWWFTPEATAQELRTVTLAWDASPTTQPPVQYRVTRDGVNVGLTSGLTITVPVLATSHTFEVRATNGNGESTPIMLQYVTVDPPPTPQVAIGQPVGLVQTATPSSITWTFTEVSGGSFCQVPNYTLRTGLPPYTDTSWGNAFPSEALIPGTVVGATRTYTLANLAPGDSRWMAVVAYCGSLGPGVAFGPLSDAVIGSALSTPPPGTGGSLTFIVTRTRCTIRAVSQPPTGFETGPGNGVQFRRPDGTAIGTRDANGTDGWWREWTNATPGTYSITATWTKPGLASKTLTEAVSCTS